MKKAIDDEFLDGGEDRGLEDGALGNQEGVALLPDNEAKAPKVWTGRKSKQNCALSARKQEENEPGSIRYWLGWRSNLLHDFVSSVDRYLDDRRKRKNK
ncbi:hypothetical protein [Mesorhizobium sp. AR10]|uniref:hypothetical protein n=1 Tax=Mesorhizobium sp. AR10 TaxID=2865839 RepID=UPI00215E0B2F|nr:hypothetical protein [Mesorhizobium sp. AR10]